MNKAVNVKNVMQALIYYHHLLQMSYAKIVQVKRNAMEALIFTLWQDFGEQLPHLTHFMLVEII